MDPRDTHVRGGPTLRLFTNRAAVRGLLQSAVESERADAGIVPFTLASAPLDVDGIERARIAMAAGAAEVAIVDLFPDVSLALHVCHLVNDRFPAVPLVGLACCPQNLTPVHLNALQDAGVDSLLDFSEDAQQLIKAIRDVARGFSVVRFETTGERPGLASSLLRRLGAHPTSADVAVSARERAILGGLAEGLTHRQISQAEGMSERTVKRIVADLQRKLDAPSLFRLGMRAAQLGIALEGNE